MPRRILTRSRSRSRGRAPSEEPPVKTAQKKAVSVSPKKSAAKQVGRPRRRSTSRSRSSSRGRSPVRAAKTAPPPRSPARAAKKAAKLPPPTPPRVSETKKAVEKKPLAGGDSEEKAPTTPTRIPRAITAVLAKGSNAGDSPAVGVRSSSRLAAKVTTGVTTTTTTTTERSVTRTGDAVDGGHEVKHSKNDFGGALGGLFLTLFLPALTYYLTVVCNKNDCSVKALSWDSMRRICSRAFDCEAYQVVLVWYAFHSLLYILPIGPVVLGQPCGPTGERLKYRCNGLYAMAASVAAMCQLVYLGYPVQFLHDKWFPMFCASTLYSFVLSAMLYVRSFYVKDLVLAPTATGSFFNDFFMGRELNPRISLGSSVPDFDFKMVVEMRCSLIGWALLGLSFAVEQYQKTGTVQWALALVVGFHFVYVLDALVSESAILTTKDILHEGFGFMLVFGDLVWVPFLYTLQSRFLLEHPTEGVSCTWGLVAICAMALIGYGIFRGANGQKNAFRRNPYDPELAHLQSIPTPRGRRLLCSSWWGWSRHPNYLGDMIMAVAWSLACGTAHIIPWFYPLTLIPLLLHRQWRDEIYCSQAHGSAWQKYCDKVPYRIIPYVY